MCWRDGKKRRYEPDVLERWKEEEVRTRRVGEMERRGGTSQTIWRGGKKRRYKTDVLERCKKRGVGMRQTCWKE